MPGNQDRGDSARRFGAVSKHHFQRIRPREYKVWAWRECVAGSAVSAVVSAIRAAEWVRIP